MGDKLTRVREFRKGANHSIKFDCQNKSLETQVPFDRGAWRAAVQGFTKSQTRLSN